MTASAASQQLHRHDFRNALVLLLVSALVLTVLNQYTDIDLWFADLHFDREHHRFPWQHTWFSVTLMHGYVKSVLVWSGLLIIAGALLDLVLTSCRLPSFPLSPLHRAQLRVLALAALLEPRLVKTIKDYNYLQCPWSVDRYTGSEPLLRILDAVPSGMQVSDCFPAGHASVGMWLVTIAVFWLPHDRRKALYAGLAGLSVGLVLGWVQQMRGAHFITHTLWTAWIAVAVAVVLVAAFSRQLRTSAKGSIAPAPAPASVPTSACLSASR